MTQGEDFDLQDGSATKGNGEKRPECRKNGSRREPAKFSHFSTSSEFTGCSGCSASLPRTSISRLGFAKDVAHRHTSTHQEKLDDELIPSYGVRSSTVIAGRKSTRLREVKWIERIEFIQSEKDIGLREGGNALVQKDCVRFYSLRIF